MLPRIAHCANGMHALSTFVATVLRTWQARQTERAYLESLEDFQLQEMGLSREDRRREASKAIWQD